MARMKGPKIWLVRSFDRLELAQATVESKKESKRISAGPQHLDSLAESPTELRAISAVVLWEGMWMGAGI